jgi:hypothetical protein
MESTDLRGPQRYCRARSAARARSSASTAIGLVLAVTVLGCASTPMPRCRPSAIAEHGEFACQGPYPYRLGQQVTSNRQGLPVRAPDSLRRPHRGLRRTDLAARRAGAPIPWASPGERHRHVHRLRSRHDEASQRPQVAVRGRQQRGGVTVLGGIRTLDGPAYPAPVLVTRMARKSGNTGK